MQARSRRTARLTPPLRATRGTPRCGQRGGQGWCSCRQHGTRSWASLSCACVPHATHASPPAPAADARLPSAPGLPPPGAGRGLLTWPAARRSSSPSLLCACVPHATHASPPAPAADARLPSAPGLPPPGAGRGLLTWPAARRSSSPSLLCACVPHATHASPPAPAADARLPPAPGLPSPGAGRGLGEGWCGCWERGAAARPRLCVRVCPTRRPRSPCCCSTTRGTRKATLPKATLSRDITHLQAAPTPPQTMAEAMGSREGGQA